MAEAGVGLLVALARAGIEASRSVKRYKTEAGRIGKRLTRVVARTEKWRSITRNPEDPIFAHFREALESVHICLQAASNAEKNWRSKIKLYVGGRELLEAIREAEMQLNQVLDDIRLEQGNVLLIRVEEGFKDVSEQLDSFGESQSESDPSKTIDQEVQEALAMVQADSVEIVIDDPHGGEKHDDDSEVSSDSQVRVPFHPPEDDLQALTARLEDIKFSEKDILGGGAFSEVFSGTYKSSPAAIKRLKIDHREVRGLTPEQLAKDADRFTREALPTFKCSEHSNIVEIFGCYVDPTMVNRAMIVMERLHITLFDAIHFHQESKTPSLSFERRFHLLKGIAGALEFLHLQGIVHHDVKPLNILLNVDMTVAKLADFGEAKTKGLNTTKSRLSTIMSTSGEGRSVHAQAGTIAYQAPEILAEEVAESSRVSEIYSFGVTIWECMTGSIPHHGKKENSITILARVKKEKPMLQMPKIPSKESMSSGDIDAWMHMKFTLVKCISRNRKERMTASEVVRAWQIHPVRNLRTALLQHHRLALLSPRGPAQPLSQISHKMKRMEQISKKASLPINASRKGSGG